MIGIFFFKSLYLNSSCCVKTDSGLTEFLLLWFLLLGTYYNYYRISNYIQHWQNGNGREWECWKSFPHITRLEYPSARIKRSTRTSSRGLSRPEDGYLLRSIDVLSITCVQCASYSYSSSSSSSLAQSAKARNNNCSCQSQEYRIGFCASRES